VLVTTIFQIVVPGLDDASEVHDPAAPAIGLGPVGCATADPVTAQAKPTRTDFIAGATMTSTLGAFHTIGREEGAAKGFTWVWKSEFTC
jgi:hypothetical protein